MRYDGPGKHYYICDRCGISCIAGGVIPEHSKHMRRNTNKSLLCVTKIDFIALKHETYSREDRQLKSIVVSQLDLCRKCSEDLFKFLGFQELTEEEANIMCDEEDDNGQTT